MDYINAKKVASVDELIKPAPFGNYMVTQTLVHAPEEQPYTFSEEVRSLSDAKHSSRMRMTKTDSGFPESNSFNFQFN